MTGGPAPIIRDRTSLAQDLGPVAYITDELLARAIRIGAAGGRHPGEPWIEIGSAGPPRFEPVVRLLPEGKPPVVYVLEGYDPRTFLSTMRWPD